MLGLRSLTEACHMMDFGLPYFPSHMQTKQISSQYLTTYMDVSGLLHGSIWYTVLVY